VTNCVDANKTDANRMSPNIAMAEAMISSKAERMMTIDVLLRFIYSDLQSPFSEIFIFIFIFIFILILILILITISMQMQINEFKI
jgi:hypothetical protein